MENLFVQVVGPEFWRQESACADVTVVSPLLLNGVGGLDGWFEMLVNHTQALRPATDGDCVRFPTSMTIPRVRSRSSVTIVPSRDLRQGEPLINLLACAGAHPGGG